MTANAPTVETLRTENAELHARLEEAEEMLRAIRAGEVDALVVESPAGPRIFTLQGLDADVNRFRGEILAQVSDAVIAVDNLQRVTYLNAAAEQLYGVSASEVLGCHLSGIHESIWQHPADEARAAAALRETGRWCGESIHGKRDGSTIHVESSVSMLHDLADGTGSGQLSVIRDITERKRAEEALRESERRFRLALKNSPVSVAIQDRNLVYQWAYNQKSRRPDEIIGKTDADLFAPEDVVWIHEVKQRVLETGKDVHVQHWVTSNGQRLFLDLTYEPLRDPGGEVSGIGIAVVDLTQQKLVEEALKASEERHRLLAETMLQGVVHQDADGTIIAMNPAAERILGRTREQYVGGSSLQEEILTIREDGSTFPGLEHPAMVALRTRQTVREVVMGVFNPQLGAYRWLSIDAVPIIQLGENPSAEVYAVFEDITERKQAEEMLRQGEERLRLALHAARMATWDWDILTGQVIWNDEHYRMLGYEPHGVQSGYEAWVQRIHPDDRAKTEALLQCAMEDGTDYSAEFRVVRPDGTEHWIEARGQFERDASGRTVRCYGVMIDFTERKQAEEQIKHSLAEKEVLLKEIHHRVKNNLQVISSLISLQASSLSDDKAREALGDISDRVRTIALVHEKFYQTNDLVRLNFADYAASLLNYLWHTHGTLAGKVRLALAMVPVVMPVEPAVTCGLILNELAGNALKHAFPNGNGGEITVGLDRDPATDTLCLWVRDNGTGLPDGLEWRQANTLGLRLVRMLAGQLRGTVATGPGPGTEFRVTFIQKGNYS